MKCQIFLIAIFAFIINSSLFGQSAPLYQPPTITPASPRVAAFQIYGDYPVSYNTGVPDISIPLYKIQSGGIEIPITLRYHIGSIKIDNSIFSNVALGWNLDVGGVISRTINHKPDERDTKTNISPFLSYNQDGCTDDCDYLANAAEHTDSEYDVFRYDVLSYHNAFLVEQKNDGYVSPIYLSGDPLKIKLQQNQYKTIQTIQITGDRGEKMIFGGDGATDTLGGNNSFQYAKDWWLSQITQDNGDIISFKYYSKSYTPSYFFQKLYHWGYKWWIYNPNSSNELQTYERTIPYDYSTNEYDGSSYNTIFTIKEIDFALGKVLFYSDDNINIRQVDVLDKNDSLIKSIVFTVENFIPPNDNCMRCLKKVEIKDKNRITVEVYNLVYNNIGSITFIPHRDYWGYFRGEYPGYCPYLTLSYPITDETVSNPIIMGDGGILKSDSTYAKYFALKKIIYPTGGETEFEFELNQYHKQLDASNEIGEGAGLRIRKIINRDEKGIISTKTYTYQPGNLEVDPENSLDKIVEYAISGMTCELPLSYQYSYWTKPTGWFPASAPDGNIVHYTQVTEYLGTPTENQGRREFNYDNDKFYKIERSFLSNSYPRSHVSEWKYWRVPKLINEKDYDYSGNLKQETQYQYTTSSLGIYYNLNIRKQSSYQGGYDCGLSPSHHVYPISDFDGRDLLIYYNVYPPQVYEYYYSTIEAGAKLLNKITIHNYLNGQDVVSEKQYSYSNLSYGQYIKTETNLESNGAISQIEYKHPFDFTDAVSKAMTNNNVVYPVIESIKSVSSQVVQTVHSQYDSVSVALYRPKIISASVYSNSLENRLIYYNYDIKGNPLDVAKAGGTHTVYLWSYNYQYPVIKIEGISYSDLINNYYSQSSIDQLAQTALPSQTQIDAIRSTLANANVMVTTYTYTPLVGIVTATDPKGVMTTYSYDTFNRLLNIKNHEGNILNEYHYHYNNQ